MGKSITLRNDETINLLEKTKNEMGINYVKQIDIAIKEKYGKK